MMNMKTQLKAFKINNNKFYFLLFVGLFISGKYSTLLAQPEVQLKTIEFTKPSWWFGAAVGANFNYYQGSTQQLTDNLIAPVPFHEGKGIGLFVAPLVEYQNPNSRWGAMLQVGYDNRNAKFKEVISPCNCPLDLTTKLSYIAVEPSLRFAPFKSNFYLFGGPRIAFNLNKSFVYTEKNDPSSTDQTPIPDVNGDFNKINNILFSLQIGAGYDIHLTAQKKRSQFVISPFVSFQPYFGQDPRTIETWNITTIRAGAAFKFGRGCIVNSFIETQKPTKLVIIDPPIYFAVQSPKNIAVERRVRETFPLRNYVFFDLASTEIPDRYVLLSKNQVKDFKEDQLEVLIPKRLSGRSSRQLIVYYNVLNILGDRMSKNPTATIKLIGASEQGVNDALLMTRSVRNYLHDIFGIDTSRILMEGALKPKLPTMQIGVTREIDLHKECDRRVSIESNTPGMLMQFQSGPDAPLKPIEMTSLQIAPPNSYISFNNPGSSDIFSSWSIEIKDKTGEIQKFGPYNKEKISIPGKLILGNRSEGNYTVTMIGQTYGGRIIRRDTMVNMVLWKSQKDEQAMRYSILYEFNNSKAIAIYDKYLTDVIIPKIPIGGTVIIHGYTDVLGDDDYNLKLSIDRANDVFAILKSGLANVGRSDVVFEVYGYGEDPLLMPFENGTPEERFYNRTVIIDIIPKN